MSCFSCELVASFTDDAYAIGCVPLDVGWVRRGAAVAEWAHAQQALP